MKDLCVIIPVYKERLTRDEELSVERTCNVLVLRDIYFVAPIGLPIEYYTRFTKQKNVRIEYFEMSYFKGIRGYNKLMLDLKFYYRFQAYQYMLIAQPDAFILSKVDKINSFMKLGYHYWGAPWSPYQKIYCFDIKGARFLGRLLCPIVCKSGNGGFSLRHIAATTRLLKRKRITSKLWCHNYNEDGFFSYFAHNKKYDWFRCPSVEEAARFAMEADMKEKLEQGCEVFAVHAWKKMLGDIQELEKYIEI